MLCYVCPHRCGVDRPESINDTDGMFGCCGVGILPVVSRAGIHMWEEPCLSGTKGAGTLKEIYHELIDKGVHNIDLVTPTHFAYSILQSLDEKLPVPVVYNSSGFEATDTLLKFEGKVQIWLPDLKYSDDTLALKYSNAYDYWNISRKAIQEMFRQVGPYRLDADGIMKSGVIIRHLVLPGFMENTKRVIDWVAQTFKPGDVMFSLMHQYVPCGRANEYPELNRKVTPEEYKEVEDYLFDSGIEDGFVQEEESACGEFIPCFDGTGV